MQDLARAWGGAVQQAMQDRVKSAAKRVAGRDGSGADGVETYGRRNGGDPPGARDPRRTSGVAGCTDQERRGERREKGEETYGHGDGEVGDLRQTLGARDPRRTSDGGGEQPGDGDARRARAGEWERVEQKLDASDIRACGGFLPLGRTGLASGTLTETAAGAADVEGDGRSGESATAVDTSEGFRTRRPPTAACGGTSPTSGEGFTNEPELHENVIPSQDQNMVGVTVDSGVDSGLDKREVEGNGEQGEAFRMRRPPPPPKAAPLPRVGR